MSFHLVVTHILGLLGFLFFQSSLGWWMSYYQTPSLIYNVLTQKCTPNWYASCSHTEMETKLVCQLFESQRVREREGGGRLWETRTCA